MSASSVMYVCKCVCMYVCMYVCVCVCMYVRIYAHFEPLLAKHTDKLTLTYVQHTAGFLRQAISPSHGLYLHRTAQRRETKDKHPYLKRDSNPRPSVPARQTGAASGSAACIILPVIQRS
jgi:hypothetical protein